MRTGYFAALKKLEPHEEPVAIAVGVPRWYKGRRLLALAPTRAMLKMNHEQYAAEMDAMLAKLDPLEIAEELGPNAVLLCWERPFELCHRRRIAEWLEAATGQEIPEVGFTRQETRAYAEMDPPKPKAPRRRSPMPMTLF
ncbi:MAG TPA: hypothetical protein VFH61_04280 [Thermoleophilia bacterium]|nr:hypothetical protein [Thermoleophilia bacterium]